MLLPVSITTTVTYGQGETKDCQKRRAGFEIGSPSARGEVCDHSIVQTLKNETLSDEHVSAQKQ